MLPEVRAVATAQELEAFLRLPERLHRGNPGFVPPLLWLFRRRLGSDNASRQRGHLVLLGAWRDGQLIGRLTVMLDEKDNAHRGIQVAWFGFFECVNEQAVADALFDAAARQARAWGMPVLRGQRNLTRLEDPGIMVLGGQRPPPMLAAWHPSWYPALLQGAGFAPEHDVLGYAIELFDDQGQPTPLPEGLRRKAEAVDLPGLEVRSLSWRRASRDLRLLHRVFNDTYMSVPGTSPIPWGQFRVMGLAFLVLTSRHMVQLALVQGAPAGFVVCLPEVNEALGALRGRLNPLALLRLLWAWRRIQSAAFKLIGVMPEHRGSGLHALLVANTVKSVRQAGFTRVDGSLIDERNKPMRGVVEGAGMTEVCRYRVYERAVGES